MYRGIVRNKAYHVAWLFITIVEAIVAFIGSLFGNESWERPGNLSRQLSYELVAYQEGQWLN
jgi:hypothetical protein